MNVFSECYDLYRKSILNIYLNSTYQNPGKISENHSSSYWRK